jgi:hypothetical protein
LRKSIIAEVKPHVIENFFKGVTEGINFYQELFGVKYAFSKYD